jgi:N-acetylmuramoyl-L-alanine amidase
MSIFFAFYNFLLSRFTFFKLNRWYLLVSLVLSFVIPTITIAVKPLTAQTDVIVKPTIVLVLKPTNLDHYLTDNTDASYFNINRENIIWKAYLAITACVFIKWVITLAYMFYSLRKSFGKVGRVRLVRSSERFKNSSFFGLLFIDETLQGLEREQIIKHEMFHIKMMHSIDKLLISLVKIVLWFNPFAYAYARAIDTNHEYEVDWQTKQLFDTKEYAYLLLKLASSNNHLNINQFSSRPLKKRVDMLFKKPTKNMKKSIYLSVLPLLLLCIMAFSKRKEVLIYKNNGKTTVTSKPDKVLIVDAGHGGKDIGGTAINGAYEKDLNLKFAEILKMEAEKRKVNVVLTRNADEFITLRDRLNNQNGHTFISVHHNTNTATTGFNGIEILISKETENNKASEKLAMNVLTSLRKLNGIAVSDTIKNADIYLLRSAKIPALTLELGNINSAESFNFISREDNIRKVCNLILDGYLE